MPLNRDSSSVPKSSGSAAAESGVTVVRMFVGAQMSTGLPKLKAFILLASTEPTQITPSVLQG